MNACIEWPTALLVQPLFQTLYRVSLPCILYTVSCIMYLVLCGLQHAIAEMYGRLHVLFSPKTTDDVAR